MANYTKTEVGPLHQLAAHHQNGKAFLHDTLGLTSCEISVSFMPAGSKLPFQHTHKQNEEVYLFLKGTGTLTLDGEAIAVQEGSCVRVLPPAVRTMEAKTDLYYICVQAKENSLTQFGLGDGELC